MVSMVWGGNQHAMYADCAICGLNRAIFVQRAPSAVHVTREPSPEKAPYDSYIVDMPAGFVMLDTGCKASVGGSTWHEALQAERSPMS